MDQVPIPNPSGALDDAASANPSQTRKALAIALGLSGVLFAIYLWILVSPLFRQGGGNAFKSNSRKDSSRVPYRVSQSNVATQRRFWGLSSLPRSKGASTAGPSTIGTAGEAKASIFADLSGHPTLCSPPPTYTRRASWEGHRLHIQNDTFSYPPSYRKDAHGLKSDSAYDIGGNSDGHLSRIRSSLGSVPVILRPSTPDSAIYDIAQTLGYYDTQDAREPELPPGLESTTATTGQLPGHVGGAAQRDVVANHPLHYPRSNGAEDIRRNVNYPPNQTVVRSGAVLPRMVADHIQELPAAYRPRPSRAEFVNATIPR